MARRRKYTLDQDTQWRRDHEPRWLSDMQRVVENPDGTVEMAMKKAPKDRSSLHRMSLESHIEDVNRLSRVELLAISVAVKTVPFPLGNEEKVYAECLRQLQKAPHGFFAKGSPVWTAPLSTIRASLAHRAAQGFNAPHDTYLHAAIAVVGRDGTYFEPAHLTNEYRGQQRLPGIAGLRGLGTDQEDGIVVTSRWFHTPMFAGYRAKACYASNPRKCCEAIAPGKDEAERYAAQKLRAGCEAAGLGSLTRVTFAGKFPLGQTVLTRGVNDRVASSSAFAKFVLQSLRRHAQGDWGDVDPADAKENDFSVSRSLRILSSYKKGNEKIWIITEADRSVTTVLFPDEY